MRAKVRIIPRRNEKIQQTLRRFRKILEKEGIIKEMKRNMYYEPPSVVKSRNRRRRKREQEKELRNVGNPVIKVAKPTTRSNPKPY